MRTVTGRRLPYRSPISSHAACLPTNLAWMIFPRWVLRNMLESWILFIWADMNLSWLVSWHLDVVVLVFYATFGTRFSCISTWGVTWYGYVGVDSVTLTLVFSRSDENVPPTMIPQTHWQLFNKMPFASCRRYIKHFNQSVVSTSTSDTTRSWVLNICFPWHYTWASFNMRGHMT